ATLNRAYEPDALISKSLGSFKPSSRKVLGGCESSRYQSGVRTEARVAAAAVRCRSPIPTLRRLKENRRCLMKPITACGLRKQVKEMRGCLSTRPGCGPTPRQTSRRVGGGRGR